MDRFWNLFEKSTVTTFFVTMGIFGVCCYLWATGKEVPEMLSGAMWSVLGYFFGVKGQLELRKYKARAA